MSIPADLKYVASHEWIRVEADGSATIGITQHAQELLGDIVFVELPEVGATFSAEDQAGSIESVKAASDVYSPISGEVVAVNEDLTSSPELVNSDPYGAWFFKIKPSNPAELETLLTAEQYAGEIA